MSCGIKKSIRLGGEELSTPLICASVIDVDMDSLNSGLEKASKLGADILEIRVDKLEGFPDWGNFLFDEKPVIVTNRSKEEGGYFKGGEEERVEVLLDAINFGVSCVDIEFSTSEELRNKVMKEALKNNVSVIASYHDFEGVPPREKLVDKAVRMSNSGCDFVKIVGFSNDLQESIDILKFLIRSQRDLRTPLIAFAMGEKGKLTRYTAPLLGSPIVYASVVKKAAPGQLDVSTVREILDKYK